MILETALKAILFARMIGNLTESCRIEEAALEPLLSSSQDSDVAILSDKVVITGAIGMAILGPGVAAYGAQGGGLPPCS